MHKCENCMVIGLSMKTEPAQNPYKPQHTLIKQGGSGRFLGSKMDINESKQFPTVSCGS